MRVRKDSARLPTQICAWNHGNILDDRGDTSGQYLYALKATEPGDRQLVWEGGSERGIVAVVDFATAAVRVEGIWYAWGNSTPLTAPLTHNALREDPALEDRFFGSGGKGWLQGRAKNCPADIAGAISALAGGLPPPRLPTGDPSDQPFDRWFGDRDIDPECVFELAVIASRRLRRAIGFTGLIVTQRNIGPRSRPDLRSDGVIGEVKRTIAPKDVAQVERYLEDAQARWPRPDGWRAVLIHNGRMSPAVARALDASKDSPRIEVWRLDERHGRGFDAVRERKAPDTTP